MSKDKLPVVFTRVQRAAIAELLPDLSGRLYEGELNPKAVRLSTTEMTRIVEKAKSAIQLASGVKRYSLRCIVERCRVAIERFQGIGLIPKSERIYQFKITLRIIKPPIWRRIQIRDCTLDRLHKCIQLAMGWKNAHLHRFEIGGKEYGDPDQYDDGFDDINVGDTRMTKLSDIVPYDGSRFPFRYEYDFGDRWRHGVLFEGCLRAESGVRYPICAEGERACPPEDVGGTYGYYEYLEALADTNHPEHRDWLRWRGRFDSEKFDAVAATKRMRRGLPRF